MTQAFDDPCDAGSGSGQGAGRVVGMVGSGVDWLGLAVLSVVFLAAGVLKVGDPAGMQADVLAYELIGRRLAAGAALGLPWLEVTAGAMLWWPRVRRGAAGVMLVMLLGFTAALVSAWARGLVIDCGCFGDWMSGWGYPWLLGRNVVLIAACGWVLVWRGR